MAGKRIAAMMIEGVAVTMEDKYSKKNLARQILSGCWTIFSRIDRVFGSNHQIRWVDGAEDVNIVK